MAKDIYHDAVKTALIKDGWTIIEEGVHLRPDNHQAYFVDILAERYLFAQKAQELIIVEVKTFGGKSDTYQLHDKVWFQCNYTDLLIEEELVNLGIPKSDIMFGWLPEYAREHSGCGVEDKAA